MSESIESSRIDRSIGDDLKPVKDTSFRDLVGGAVYIKDVFSFLSRSPEELDLKVEGYPDAITYCYVDEEMGMCFGFIAAARIVDGKLELLDAFEDIALTMRRETLLDALCAPLDGEVLLDYAEALAAMDEAHPVDDFTQGMRDLVELDGLRNEAFPDAIKAALVGAGDDDVYELVWVKPVEPAEGVDPQAVLMSEPSNEALGAHEGDALPLVFQKQPDGIIAVVQAKGE